MSAYTYAKLSEEDRRRVDQVVDNNLRRVMAPAVIRRHATGRWLWGEQAVAMDWLGILPPGSDRWPLPRRGLLYADPRVPITPLQEIALTVDSRGAWAGMNFRPNAPATAEVRRELARRWNDFDVIVPETDWAKPSGLVPSGVRRSGRS